MSDSVILNNYGEFVCKYWNSDDRLYEKTILSKARQILSLWYTEIILEDKVSLYQVFSALRSLEDYKDLEPLLRCKLDPIINEGFSRSNDKKSDLSSLGLYWLVELQNDYVEDSKDFSGHERLWFSPSLHGLDDKNPEEKYSVGFTPVNEIIDTPLKLNDKFEAVNWIGSGKGNAFSTLKSWTLGDFLYGIFFELSFFGVPEERDAKMREIEKSYEEVKSGEAKLIPWEEVKKNLEDRIKGE